MLEDEKSASWPEYTAVYTITRFFPASIAKTLPALHDIVGVETWVDLHLRPIVSGNTDLAKEALVITQAGERYTICIEGSHFISPTSEAIQQGIWRAGDWLITVSGVTPEQLEAGDLLVQKRDASDRPERKRKHM